MLSKSKNIFIFIFNILISSVFPQSYFNTYYQSGLRSTADKIIEIQPGKLMLSSYYKDSINAAQGIDLKHLDFQGNVLLRKRYLFNGYDFGVMQYNPDFQGDISNSTALLTAGSSSNTVIFTSVNKNTLDTNWVRYFNGGVYHYYLNTVFKTKPNEFWLFGNRGSSTASISSRPAVVKVDSMGNVLSVKEFATLIKHLPDASYYDPVDNLIYMTGNNSTNQSAFKEFVACMDTTGNVLWNIDLISTPYQPHYFDICKKNNYLVLVGSQGEFEHGGWSYDRLNVLKLNSINGSVIWNKKYHTAFWVNTMRSLVINEDESIVACGTTALYSSVIQFNNDGYFLKLNSAGDSLWMQTYSNYGQGVYEGFYDIIKSSDGGYVACGHSDYTNNAAFNHSWVVKTDSLGMAPGRSTGIEQHAINSEFFNIYPNPANERLTLQLKDENLLGKIVSIKIYNSLMQMVLEKEIEITDSKILLNTANFKGGIYTLQLNGIYGLVNHKLIIEH